MRDVRQRYHRIDVVVMAPRITNLLFSFLLAALMLTSRSSSCYGGQVVFGNEVLRASNYAELAQLRVAILTNPTGVFSDTLIHIVDDMHANKDVDLVAIFGPEHGFRGEKQAETGDEIVYIDAQTGLPVFSAYNMTVAQITRAMVDLRVQALVVDMQDVGTRLYTFIWTMYNTLVAAKGAAPLSRVLILDRVNPLGE
jgi:uncharacterized protein YbbC (DUF1343 family)